MTAHNTGELTICSVPDCGLRLRSPGAEYCEMHYGRVRRTGALELPEHKPAEWKVCRAEGCAQLSRTRGGALCEMHYKRGYSGFYARQQTRAERDAKMREMYESGMSTVEIGTRIGLDHSYISRILRDLGVTMRPFGGTAGADHPRWKADAVTYSGAHMRVRAIRGKASANLCACGSRAAQWAYLHDDPNEMHSPLGSYSADPLRYEAMCIPCHKRFDLARIRNAS